MSFLVSQHDLCRRADELRRPVGSHAILICYDITSYQSFQNAEDWLGLVRPACTSCSVFSRRSSRYSHMPNPRTGVQVRNVFKEPGAMPYIGLIANKVWTCLTAPGFDCRGTNYAMVAAVLASRVARDPR